MNENHYADPVDYYADRNDNEEELLQQSESVEREKNDIDKIKQSQNSKVPVTEPETHEVHVQDKSQNKTPIRSQVHETKPTSSVIWKHVSRTKDKNSLVCNYCQKHFKACGNTTNMRKHLQSQHPLFLKYLRQLLK